jgi:2-keto-4-pentenoate hydratase
MTLTADVVDAAGARLLRAIAAHVPCEPVRDLIGTDDIEIAYGAGAPDRGPHQLWRAHSRPKDRTDVRGSTASTRVGFILGQDLTASDLDAVSVRAAVDHMRAALEIVDSRIQAWDISFGDTVAGNASSGLFVLGDAKVTLDRSQPSAAAMTMTLDGHEVSAGSGQACLGNPLHALAWLANAARDLGSPLLAGQIILSGALGPMAPVVVGSKVVATISGLGTVTAQFH